MTTLATLSAADPGQVTTAANTAYNVPIAGRCSLQSTEAFARVVLREAGNLQNMYVRVTANAITASSTVTMRDNAVNVNETKSITASTTGEFEDTLNTDTITAGHTYDIQFVPGDSTHTASFSVFRTLFNTTTNTATRMVCALGSGGVSYTTATTTYYFVPNGGNASTQTTEGPSKTIQKKAGTMQNGFVYVNLNTKTSASTLNSRIDTGSGSANGNIAVSITASTAGAFEDTTVGHTDSVTAGNYYNYALVMGSDASHQTQIGVLGCTYLNTSGYTYIMSGSNVGTSPASTSIKYYPVGGCFVATTTTESIVQEKAGENKQFGLMTINLSANNTGTGTATFRINAANGKQSISVTASTTGDFTDPVNMDYAGPSDEVNYSFAPGASSGVTVQYLESWAVKAYTYSSSDTTSISDSKQRTVVRQSQPIFAHTYN